MPSARAKQERVRRIFRRLYSCWGAQHWWPARNAFEMVLGAFLTQNTAWTNVEKAITRLRAARKLSVDGIRRLPLRELEELIRPAGYFCQKATRLKAFVAHLDARHAGSLRRMLRRPTQGLRDELLSLNGVGPETADSILLYAGNHPVFVVDAYTHRIFRRHYLSDEKTSYEEIRSLVEIALKDEWCAPGSGDKPAARPPTHPPSALSSTIRDPLPQVFNEFHALLVQVGKHHCLKNKPRCEECPLRGFPHQRD